MAQWRGLSFWLCRMEEVESRVVCENRLNFFSNYRAIRVTVGTTWQKVGISKQQIIAHECTISSSPWELRIVLFIGLVPFNRLVLVEVLRWKVKTKKHWRIIANRWNPYYWTFISIYRLDNNGSHEGVLIPLNRECLSVCLSVFPCEFCGRFATPLKQLIRRMFK